MIKLENIQKVFRTEEVETVALGGVSLEVKKGRGERRTAADISRRTQERA